MKFQRMGVPDVCACGVILTARVGPPADATAHAACMDTRMHGIERADRRPLVLGRPWLLLLGPCDVNVIEKIAARFATPLIHWVALLDLCAAYLQGGIVKAINFNDAIAEMEHFSLAPAAPFAIAVIP